MSGVPPLILDLEMKTRDLFDLTSPTVRSALLGRELTLGSSEVTLRFGAEMITFLEFTVTCGNLIHDPEIDANLTTCSLQRHRGHVHIARITTI